MLDFRFRVVPLLMTLAGCSPGVIQLHDNSNPEAPRKISSDLIVSGEEEDPRCGCPSGTTSYLEDLRETTIPRQDLPVSCQSFRPLNTRRDGYTVGDLKITVSDDAKVGCVQVVASGGRRAGFVDVRSTTSPAVQHGSGVCPEHSHDGHSPEDAHYRFEFSGTQEDEAAEFTMFRDTGSRGSGVWVLASRVQASYFDGNGEEKKTVPVYVFGPRSTACDF